MILMLIRTRESVFRVEWERGLVVHGDTAAEALGVSRRQILRVGLAGAIMATIPRRAWAGPPMPKLAIGTGGRELKLRGVAEVQAQYADLVASWWVGDRAEDVVKALVAPTSSRVDVGASSATSATGTTATPSDVATNSPTPYLGKDDDGPWIGPLRAPQTTLTNPNTGKTGGSVTIDSGAALKKVTEAVEQWHTIMTEGLSQTSLLDSRAEGTAMMVLPGTDSRIAKVHCQHDIDSTFFLVPRGVMPAFVGRRSNWVQVSHPDWAGVMSDANGNFVPSFGYFYMDARDLAWFDDGSPERLLVADSAEDFDGYSPPCKDPEKRDELCRAHGG